MPARLGLSTPELLENLRRVLRKARRRLALCAAQYLRGGHSVYCATRLLDDYRSRVAPSQARVGVPRSGLRLAARRPVDGIRVANLPGCLLSLDNRVVDSRRTSNERRS